MAVVDMPIVAAVKTAMQKIGPREAQELLDSNVHNRKIRQTRVAQLAGAMKRGEWVFNGDPIRISATGLLLDGQHRLLAIIESGTTQEFLVISGLPDDVQETIDTGAKRTVGDVLKLRGEIEVNKLAAITRMVLYYEKYKTMRHPIILPTTQEVIAALDRHPAIRDVIAPTRPTIKNTQLASGPVGACYYLFSLVDQADTDVFFTRIAIGAELKERSPIHALRRRFLQPRPVATRLAPYYQAALMIKAWNLWRAGGETDHVRYSPAGALAEKFPLIDGLDLWDS